MMAAAALTPADIEALERKLRASPRDNGTNRKMLASLRARKMRRPDLVVGCAQFLLGGSGIKLLGASEVWDVREQFFLACLDLHMMDHAQHQFDLLTAKFPGSVRVQGLKGMMLEAYAGQSEMPKKEAEEFYQAALDVYDLIIKDNPTNAFARKRKACVMRGVGSSEGMAESIRLLNEYLGLYPTDIDGWRELGEWYLEAGHVEAAKTAFEECVMLAPINYVTHTMLADTLYTLGDFATARKYYAQSLELNGSKTNSRAAMGMVLCTTAINGKRNSTADEKNNNPQLFEIGKSVLIGSYDGLQRSSKAAEVGSLVKSWLK